MRLSLRQRERLLEHGAKPCGRWSATRRVASPAASHDMIPVLPGPPISRGEVAQLVEHVTENHGVDSSIPPLGTKFEK